MTNAVNKTPEVGAITLLQFYAAWCYPCKMMMLVIASIQRKKYDWLNVQQIDIDAQETVADSYHVRAVPTFVALKDNKEVWRSSGVLPEHTLIETLSMLK